MKTISALLITLIVILCQGVGAQEYSGAINDAQKQSRKSDYQAFPNWQNIEFIHDGQRRDAAKYVDAKKWSPGTNFERLRWLALNDFAIAPSKIAADGATVVVPFIIDIRFQEDTDLGIAKQATYPSEGNIILQILNGEIKDIKVTRYQTSNGAEHAARQAGTVAGSIDKYDANFVNDVVKNPLKAYLDEPQNKQKLLEIVTKSLGKKVIGDDNEEALP
jgi:hypothetical protein